MAKQISSWLSPRVSVESPMPRSSAISRRVRPLVSASRIASRRNSGVGLFPFPIEHLLVPQLVLSTLSGQARFSRIRSRIAAKSVLRVKAASAATGPTLTMAPRVATRTMRWMASCTRKRGGPVVDCEHAVEERLVGCQDIAAVGDPGGVHETVDAPEGGKKGREDSPAVGDPSQSRNGDANVAAGHHVDVACDRLALLRLRAQVRMSAAPAPTVAGRWRRPSFAFRW